MRRKRNMPRERLWTKFSRCYTIKFTRVNLTRFWVNISLIGTHSWHKMSPIMSYRNVMRHVLRRIVDRIKNFFKQNSLISAKLVLDRHESKPCYLNIIYIQFYIAECKLKKKYYNWEIRPFCLSSLIYVLDLFIFLPFVPYIFELLNNLFIATF